MMVPLVLIYYNIPICIAAPKLSGSFLCGLIMSLRLRGRPFCEVLLFGKYDGDSEFDSL